MNAAGRPTVAGRTSEKVSWTLVAVVTMNVVIAITTGRVAHAPRGVEHQHHVGLDRRALSPRGVTHAARDDNREQEGKRRSEARSRRRSHEITLACSR